jgi:hypothetical protein
MGINWFFAPNPAFIGSIARSLQVESGEEPNRKSLLVYFDRN